jgi:hypothetical protein
MQAVTTSQVSTTVFLLFIHMLNLFQSSRFTLNQQHLYFVHVASFQKFEEGKKTFFEKIE